VLSLRRAGGLPAPHLRERSRNEVSRPLHGPALSALPREDTGDATGQRRERGVSSGVGRSGARVSQPVKEG